jgi:hypothetical protein
MDMIGVISAVLSVLGAIVAGVMTTWSAQRSRKLEAAIEAQRRQESKAEQTEEIISRYREPLLLAAHSLQSRLHNAIGGTYLRRFLHCGDEEQERYARDFSVYCLGEYLCWVEIIRRELRFLDLGDEDRNRDLHRRMEMVSEVLASQKIEPAQFRLFRGQQRAVGELLMVTNSHGRADCMTYPDFCARLDSDKVFREQWFQRLRNDVDVIDALDWDGNVRLVQAQHALIDLIDFLDPHQVRLATRNRAKVQRKLPVDAAPAELAESLTGQ